MSVAHVPKHIVLVIHERKFCEEYNVMLKVWIFMMNFLRKLR